jgi:polar amino acid transport system substrate-binding protein
VPVPAPQLSFVTAAPSGSPAAIGHDVSCQKSPAAMSQMPSPGAMPLGSTMRTIQDRGYLIAGVDQDSYKWGYPNPFPSPTNGGEYKGFDIDMLHALSYAIFKDANKIHFVPVGQDYRLRAANQGIVDVVADSITITCKRNAQVSFSVDYFDAGASLLVPREDSTTKVLVSPSPAGTPHIEVAKDGTKDGKVCTVGSTTSVDSLKALANDGHFGIVLADNWSDCLALLQQGAVQAFSTDNTILSGIAAEDLDLKLVGPTFSYEPHGLAFPMKDSSGKSNSQFVSFANGVILGVESKSSPPGDCPQARSSSESCWMAMYRAWVQPPLDTTAGPPSPRSSP